MKILILWILSYLGLSLSSLGKPHQKRNLVLVMTEDHAIQTLSSKTEFKLENSPMPNLSELLRGGLNFTNAYCTNANTGPSTASFLTGRHPHKNNLLHNGDKFSGTHATVAKILQKNGYETALFGKWDFITPNFGARRERKILKDIPPM